MSFAAMWLDLEILILSEVSQKEKEKYHMTSVICGIENIAQINLSTEQKQTQTQKTDLWLPRGGERSRMDGEFCVSRCTLLHLEWISNEVLLYNTGKYIQSLVIKQDRREYEKKLFVYMYD